MARWKLVTALAVQLAIIGLVTLGLLEALVAWSFRYPAASPLPLQVVRQMHVLFDRNTIQVMPECAVYDPALTYTLRPGTCTFANREFRTTVSVNAIGVRDDDASLVGPEIIVLGDSLAMGWGVEQDESFPAVLERLSGRRLLNAAVSSYGTVRELRMLERLDRTALKDLIIQYSGNDLLENEQFVAGRFTTLTREAYAQTVNDQARMLAYHPGKHALNLAFMLRNLMTRPRPATVSPDHEAEMFVGVLTRSALQLDGARLTVTAYDSVFLEAVRRRAGTSSYAPLRTLRTFDMSTVMSAPDNFFVLDDHPTARGHATIARGLLDALGAP